MLMGSLVFDGEKQDNQQRHLRQNSGYPAYFRWL